MTYCTRCGALAIGHGVYCASCGARIVRPEPARPERPAQDAPSPDSAPPVPQVQVLQVPWREWMWPPGQLRRSVIAGLSTYAFSVVLSAVLATIILLAVLSAISPPLGGTPGQGSAAPEI